MKKRVAVLMSTYNGQEYIVEQIESILNQKGDYDVRLIVRDDGSKDLTQAILEKYQKDNKLTWYVGSNLKPAKSFLDLVVKNGGYDYYAFSDQDDIWMDSKLITEIEKICNEKKPAIAFSNGELVDSNLVFLRRNINKNIPPTNFESIIVGSSVQGCTMLFNEALAELIRKKGMPNIVAMHDSYISRVCVAVGGVIRYIDLPLIKYRQHDKNVMGVSTNIIQTIINRIVDIFSRDTVSIADQALEILHLYSDYINDDNKYFLNKVISYKNQVSSKIFLLANKNIKAVSINMLIRLKFKIVLNNR